MAKDSEPQSSQAAGADQDWPTLYRRAFIEFGGRALWNVRELDKPTPGDALAVARQLRIEGNLAARALAERLERIAGADLKVPVSCP
jgi:hypothetical protein